MLLAVLLGGVVCFTPLHSLPLPSCRHAAVCPRIAMTSADSADADAEAALLPPKDPPVKELVKFAIPALGLWLSQPLLSLVDTSAVGLSAPAGMGASQLAALGPATTFCDGATYLFAFLNTATTNLYASALAADGDTEAVVRRASRVALICGTAIVPLLLVFGRSFLGLYVGSAAAANPELINPATLYVAIRCLSFPAVLLGSVLQAALLGAKDSLTPLAAIGYATVINVVLDLVLVTKLGWGLAGAALATLTAQVISTLVLICQARMKLCPQDGLGLLPYWVERLIHRKHSPPPTTVPTRKFLVFALPVLTLIVGKIAAYGFLTHAAAGLGSVPLATHQIVLTLFFFLSPFLEVISQTAQAFLPGYSAPPDGANKHVWRESADALGGRLLRYAVCISACAAFVGGAVPASGATFLTNDAMVRAAVVPTALPLAIGVLLTGPLAASEGVLLARRQLGFLAGVYVSTVALLPPVLLAVKRRGGTVAQLWTCFAIFQLFRATLFSGKIWGDKLWQRQQKAE